MAKRKRGAFHWKLNASGVAGLIGGFWTKQDERDGNVEEACELHRIKMLAKTWKENLKRMPKWGMVPSVNFDAEMTKRCRKETIEEAVTAAMDNPVVQELVQVAVVDHRKQDSMVRQIKTEVERSLHSARASSKAAIEQVAAVEKKLEACTRAVVRASHMKKFPTKRAGVRSTKKNGLFRVGATVYRVSNGGKSASVVSDEPMAELRQKRETVQKQCEKLATVAKRAEIQVKRSEEVVRHVVSVATSKMNTHRGIVEEDTDLAVLQEEKPSVRAGNDKFHYLYFSGAFVVGKIDSYDTESDTVIELKHRSYGLFGSVPNYEKIQCHIYMAMLKCKRAILRETYQPPGGTRIQREYVIDLDEEYLEDIKKKLRKCVRDLKRAEKDVNFRNKLIEALI